MITIWECQPSDRHYSRSFRLSARAAAHAKEKAITFFAERVAYLPPGVDRQVQLDALNCVMADRPVLFNVMTQSEMLRHMDQQFEEARQILRRFNARKADGLRTDTDRA